MEMSDEDKLIINGEMFLSVRKYIRQNKTSTEIILKLEELFKEGADINACDNNDNNNTVLHIAAQKADKDIVLYLLEKGAHLFRNKFEKTAVDVALQTNTPLGKEISEIISTKCKLAARVASQNLNSQQQESTQNQQKPALTTTENVQEYTYPKRTGTSGVSGQFYETKLLSLILHRALHDQEIENFYLAANIGDIGDFDDVCFRYSNVACFMQSKHRENTDKARLTVASVRSSTGQFSLGMYFDSFLKIRHKFSPNATDPMFQGKFEDIDTYFILYSPVKEKFDKKLSGNKRICSKLHNIICTENKINENNKSTDIFQFDYENLDLDILTTFTKHEQLKTLGKVFLKFILTDMNNMMSNDLIKIYHPALARKVISITKALEAPPMTLNSKAQKVNKSQGKSNDIYVGRFRPEFFQTEDYYLNKLKETILYEIVYTYGTKTTLSKEELKRKIKDIIDNPCADTISTIIGSPIQFDENTDKLSVDKDKLPKNRLKQDEIQKINYDLQKIQVTRTMIKDAVHVAGKKKLENLTFQLPNSFGNIDLITNKKTKEEVQDRLNFLANKLHSLINHFAKRNKDKQIKIIDISNEVVGPGKILEPTHLRSNGGIGGAVGNLLEFDMQTEMFVFNTKEELGENAKFILESLKSLTNEDLRSYRIDVVIDGFPRVTFDTYKYDRTLASKFLSKLWFYTNQAQEDTVETILKKEIYFHYNADKQKNQYLFNVHSDAIFLRFHDEIQKWWKKQAEAIYLTKTTVIFDNAKKDIVDNPLLTVLNAMFIRRIKNIGVNFRSDAMDCLGIDEFVDKDKNQILNIVSDAVVLTAAKIKQSNKFKNSDSFITLDYIDILPHNDRKTMMEELELVKDITLIIICETPLVQSSRDTLLDIVNHYKTQNCLQKQIIIITNESISIDQPNISPYNVIVLKDNNINLVDLTSQSQAYILNKYTITYQGQEVKLNVFLDNNSREVINAKILWSLLSDNKIEVGHKLVTHKYNEIKNHYINRNLKRDANEYAVGTLDDIDERIVLVSSKPCMGKTILLTHLSLETKKVDPKPWIICINLSIHDKDIEELRYNNHINTIMTFLCKTALKYPDEIKKGTFSSIDDEKIAFSCKDNENISFELQFFIHSYNTDNIIFLFDGFDKIYPQNTNEGIKLFTAIKQANKRMWITSDCYVIKILENEFGPSYKLERLSTLQQKSFLEKFWATNLKLEKLNHDQFHNLTLFINYIRRTFNYDFLKVTEDNHDRTVMPILSVPLHYIYISVLEYFKNESHSLSFCYFREKLKKKWKLDSFTSFDRYLRESEDKGSSLALTGTPLHMYIGANYFIYQMTDTKFDFRLNTTTIRERANIYLDAVSLYQQFLNVNIKKICEIENKSTIKDNQEKLRDDFFDKHKKLALYAIFGEYDVKKILTESEIREVQNTIKMIESGELKTDLIDSVVHGIPRFCHLLFAEYFVVEALADIIKCAKAQDFSNINLDSVWDFIVNGVLFISPPSLRHVFDYKLKYDPDLIEAVSNDKCKKIIFNLLLKPDRARHTRTANSDNALNIAINEGLINTTNFLLKAIQSNVNKSNVDRITTIIKSSAAILEATTSQEILSENMLKCIQNIDGETIINVLNSNNSSDMLQEIIKEKVFAPIKKLAGELVETSNRNENLVALFKEFPHHLPDFVRQNNEK